MTTKDEINIILEAMTDKMRVSTLSDRDWKYVTGLLTELYEKEEREGK